MQFCCTFLLGCIALFSLGSCRCDDSPGFFLKITKNIPRLGRRSEKDYESSFLKNYKAIPRIGRSVNNNNEVSTFEAWLNEQTYFRNLNKRVLFNPTRMSSSERELSVVQPVNSNTLIELLDKDAIPSDNVKFVHWKDFDLALQVDAELYNKVFSLGRRPDQRLKQDLNIGGYTASLFNRDTVANTGNDYLLYNHAAGDLDGTFNSNMLPYNRF